MGFVDNNKKLTMATRQQVLESLISLERVKREMGILPKMELLKTGNKSIGTFDLRELNKDIIKKCRYCATDSFN